MKIGIIGSRDFGALYLVTRYLSSFHSKEGITIISGGAKGVDSQVEYSAKEFGFKTKIFRPNIKKYGKPQCYHIRNDKIIKESDIVVAFWTGNKTHSGTWSVIQKCLNRRKNIKVIFDVIIRGGKE